MEDPRSIRTIGDFLNQVCSAKQKIQELVEANNEIEEENKETIGWYFRGQASDRWELLPGLFRTVPNICEQRACLNGFKSTLFGEEQFLIQELERYVPEAFVLCRNDVSRLAVAQHYGIPTRLLDVSENALVALYFAVADEKHIDQDGMVFVFRTSADQYKVASTGGCVDWKIQRYHTDVRPISSRPILIFPPLMTARQKAQSGAFFLFENDSLGQPIVESLNEFGRIAIPAGCKKSIRKEFEDSFRWFPHTLFPDNIDLYREHLIKDAEKRVIANLS